MKNDFDDYMDYMKLYPISFAYATQIGDRLIYTMKLDFTKETGTDSFWERMSDGMTS